MVGTDIALCKNHARLEKLIHYIRNSFGMFLAICKRCARGGRGKQMCVGDLYTTQQE